MSTLWIDFVNSQEHDHTGRAAVRDRLDEPAWVRAFLKRAGAGRVAAGPAVTRSLGQLRTLLQRLAVTVVEGRPLPSRDLAGLNRHLTARPVLRADADKSFSVELVSTVRGVDAALHVIAMSFTEFLVEGEPDRLRICENADCRWVFYDETRSRTRRWCAPTCGTLVKVRRLRAGRRKGRRGT